MQRLPETMPVTPRSSGISAGQQPEPLLAPSLWRCKYCGESPSDEDGRTCKKKLKNQNLKVYFCSYHGKANSLEMVEEHKFSFDSSPETEILLAAWRGSWLQFVIRCLIRSRQ